MTVKTTLQQLEAVQAAIEKAENGQSGSWNGKALTMADLSTLYAREERLLKRHKLETGSGGQKINQGILKRD